MSQDVDHKQAMEMFNDALQKMKHSLSDVDGMELKGNQKQIAKRMHTMYEELETSVSNFDQTDSRELLIQAVQRLEILQPAFMLNYDELLA